MVTGDIGCVHVAYCLLGILVMQGFCLAETTPLYEALSQSIRTLPPSSSVWEIQSTDLRSPDSTKRFTATLRFAPPESFHLEYGAASTTSLTGDPISRRHVFATDGSKMLLIQESDMSDSAVIARYNSAELGKSHWLGAWFWPLLLQSDEYGSLKWQQGLSDKDTATVLIGEGRLGNKIVMFGDRIDRPSEIASIGHRGGFKNTYEYLDSEETAFRSLPVAGSHRRFYVKRKAATLTEAAPHDDYQEVTFRLVERYQTIGHRAVAFAPQDLLPDGTFVTDQIADKTYFTGRNSRPVESVTQLGDRLDSVVLPGGIPLMAQQDRRLSVRVVIVSLMLLLLGLAWFLHYKKGT